MPGQTIGRRIVSFDAAGTCRMQSRVCGWFPGIARPWRTTSRHTRLASPMHSRFQHGRFRAPPSAGCGIPGFRGSRLALPKATAAARKARKRSAWVLSCYPGSIHPPHLFGKSGHHGRALSFGGSDSIEESVIVRITRTDNVLSRTLCRIHGSDPILSYEEGSDA